MVGRDNFITVNVSSLAFFVIGCVVLPVLLLAVLESAEALLTGGDAESEVVGVDEAAGVDLMKAVRGVGPVGADVAAATFIKEDTMSLK